MHAASDPLSNAAKAFALPADTLYLDCAAQAPRLHAALAAGHAALDASATPWTLSFDALEARIEALRRLAADTLFDGDIDGVALAPSAAYALATAARNLPLASGDAILVRAAQFPSNLLPWQQRCAETGARIVVVRGAPGQDMPGASCTDAMLAAIDAEPRLRVVAIEQAHWHDGALLDLDRVAQRTHAAGAALVLDLSQSLGALPVDLARWKPDFIAAAGYKWLFGSAGLAWLWAAPQWRERGIAIEQHWSARDSDQVWRWAPDAAPDFRRGARRFDAGGVADPVRLAMADAGLAQVRAWGVARIAARLGALTAGLDAALDAHGLRDWKTPLHAPHFTALRPPAARLDTVADALARERIVCTQRQGLLRIAPHLHVDEPAMRRVVQIAANAVGGRG